jgi:hypothetical protein
LANEIPWAPADPQDTPSNTNKADNNRFIEKVPLRGAGD